ncbi:MAG: PQQ-binding-like beta-propeller repeat protein, partial [Planctomycetales bacterium]|nr:PQQ-binding-like beta-propeller repeat protein [Planctomycetales bacterium]
MVVNNRLGLIFTLMFLFPPCAIAEDWNHWRGPNFNGSIGSGNPPSSWSAENNIVWRQEIPGKGSSTPIVVEGHVYLMSTVDTGKDAGGQTVAQSSDSGGRGMSNPKPTSVHDYLVLAYDLSTGREIWRRTLTSAVPHEGGHPTNTFASGSLATDGQRLIANFGSQGIYALDMEGGKLWSRDLGKM